MLTIVGDDDRGALAAALRRLGPGVVHRRVAELGPEDGPIVAVGMAASDGGATLRRRIGDATRLLVVLPSEPEQSVIARLEAFRHGAEVIEASVTARTADAIVARLRHDAPDAFGWIEIGALIEAVGARVGARLGAGRSARTQLLLGDGRAVAVAVDQLAEAIADLCSATKVASLRPIRVDDLSWDEDPQTMEADAGEIERWRRMAAKGPGPSVLGSLQKGGRARDDDGLWAPSDSDRPPAADHLGAMDADEPEHESGRTPRTSTIREARRRLSDEPPRASLLAPPVPSFEVGASVASRWAATQPEPPLEDASDDALRSPPPIALPPLPEDDATAPEAALPAVLDPEESMTRATLPARPSARPAANAAPPSGAILADRPPRGRLVVVAVSLLVLLAAVAFLVGYASSS